MKICPTCGRQHGDDVARCPHDQTLLRGGEGAPSAHAELGPGEVLGAYRLLGKIAVGGMGVIYRAEHARLGRKVALKVLRPELLERADILHRFFEEARAVNEIGHPNIIDIHDFVEDFQSNPPRVYMVMELLVGEDLASRIGTAGPLDPEETVQIAEQAVDGLIAVHRARILHRDLKPENIFLCRGEEGARRVKLLDFGVAKTFGERQQVGITDPGTAVGTPEYMAPEQVLGRDLDDRTDVYSLGLVLYDMLTDTVPFQSDRYGEVLVMQVKELPEPVSLRRKKGKPVPPRLEALVMRCLEKDPSQRFQSMRELRSALAGCLTPGPLEPTTSAPPEEQAPGPPEAMPLALESLESLAPLEPESEPRRRGALLAGLVVGVLVAGGLTLWLLSRRPDPSAAPVGRAPDAARPTLTRSSKGSTPDAAAADRAPSARPDLGAPRTKPLPKRVGNKRVEVKKGEPKPKPGLEGTVDPFNP
jgi:serine/threonine-protein kinase